MTVMLNASTALGMGSPVLIAGAHGSETEHAGAEEHEPETEHSTAAGAVDTVRDEAVLEDGIYSAEFDTDSGMFHVNEANDGRGTLTVKDGVMTIHVSLTSKNIVNLYAGLAEEAQQDGAELIEPTIDSVTYSDGYTEDVYGFDIPVPALDEEFDVALIGTKGKWYDHKVSVTDPQLISGLSTEDEAEGTTVADLGLEDGTYIIEGTLLGGSGRATIESPAELTISDGEAVVTLIWSSPFYDYMIVDGERYEPVNTEGNSVFEIPVAAFDAELAITADTTAMSEPHEIEYTICFDSASIQEADE
jgi:hypothetical protein